jgi:hypothetical protein
VQTAIPPSPTPVLSEERGTRAYMETEKISVFYEIEKFLYLLFPS